MDENRLQVEATIQDILAQFRLGDYAGALAAAQIARETYPGHADLYHVAGKILETQGALESAAEMMKLATQQSDANPKYFLELADMYAKLNRPDDAEASCKAHIAVSPDPIPGLLTLAALYEHQGNFSGAEEMLHQAVKAAGDDVESKFVRLNELGIRLKRMGKIDDAIKAFEQALTLIPTHPDVHYNCGNALMDAGKPDEAIKHYNIVMDNAPSHAEAHLHLGFAHLLKGNLMRGWREMEWRWKIPVFANTTLPTPRWKGEQINGTILLLSEQGLGDSVHFVRYADQVAKRCDRVVIFCPPPLARLMKTTPGVDDVVTWNEPIPENAAYAPMMSLPYIFKTELDTIPANVPYLSADPEDVKNWAEKLSTLPGPKIGLVWTGNPKNLRERMRAIPSDAVMELVKGCKASFVCMAKDRPTDIEIWPENLHHFGSDFTDVFDAAALVENLDLVLSIDTLMTHLAGAMNKELWILLAPAADWRYLLDHEDSPWYPSARILRRTQDENWFAFTARVQKELKARFPDV